MNYGTWGETDSSLNRQFDISAVPAPVRVFFLFGGENYYARGGVLDFVGRFPTLAAAKQACTFRGIDGWGHVAVLEAGGLRIVSEGKCTEPDHTVMVWTDA